jgi:2-dehydro-3-deoxyphosphogluconate aldolase/(4S)-4-hydroxy-2-oxoglutarate aldolase
MELLELMAYRVIPVVVLEDASHAQPLAQALRDGGLPVAEVTLRTSAALDAIAAMSRDTGLLVGAGTVVNPSQVDSAADAGARFIVSPGFDPEVIEQSRKRGLPVVPGAVTPTEIMRALAAGITTVKFFPANNFGGVKSIKALSGPFPNVKFIPTGGVSLSNLGEYLSLPCVPAVCGTWMVPAHLLSTGDFTGITRLVREAVAAL